VFTEYIRTSLDTFTSHRFRTFLTLLAIILGSFSIVLMTSLAESGLATMIRGVEKLGGQRMIFLVPKNPERAREKAFYSKGLSREDAHVLKNSLPYLDRITALKSIGQHEIGRKHGLKTTNADFIAVDRDFLSALGMKLTSGRNFNPGDFQDQRRVVLLGYDLKQKLFGPENALQQQLVLFNKTYVIIGTLQKNYNLGIGMGFDWNNFALIPEPTLTDREGVLAPLEILVVTTDKSRNDVVKRILNTLLMRKHKNIDDFEILDFNTLLGQFAHIFSMIKIVVAFISSIALVIGGVGIMNIMLVSVNERTREIGIRRAIGASSSAIRAQFLSESCLLSIFGSIIGILLALMVKSLLDMVMTRFVLPPWTGVLSIGPLLYALAAAVTIGMVFGFVPARRASTMSIDRCLRTERG